MQVRREGVGFLKTLWGLRSAVSLALVVGLVTLGSSSAEASSLSLKVQGNHLVNQNGQTIRLLGVDRSGAEYMCVSNHQVFDGPSSPASVRAMASWHINAVRVPLNEDCWLGLKGVTTGGAAYRNQIIRYVHTLEANGLYVILDLHWAAPGTNQATSQWPMADADHAPAFWSSMAATFKSNHAVLFDLFNEPYITTWPCVTYHDGNGMQSLVERRALDRRDDAADARRPPGPTTSRRGATYEPRDPDHQLVVSFHTYNFNGCDNVACWDPPSRRWPGSCPSSPASSARTGAPTPTTSVHAVGRPPRRLLPRLGLGRDRRGLELQQTVRRSS
jgi:hypothetical protein